MLVHMPRKAVFLETPKTGTTTVNEALHSVGFDRWVRWEDPAWKGSRHTPLMEDLDDSWVIFSGIRNPFDHLVSWYFQMQRQVKYEGEFDIAFIQYLMEDSTTKRHFRTTNTLLSHKDQSNTFIRFEDLKESLNVILRRLYLPEVEYLPSRNVSRKRDRDYRVYYTPEIREHVEQRFAEDLERFNYTF